MSSSASHHDSNDDSKDPSLDGGGREGAVVPEGLLPELGLDRTGWNGHGADLGAEQAPAVVRAHLVARWLQQLERHTAPSLLGGLVALRQLQRPTAPSLLGGLVALRQLQRPTAPSSLDGLVVSAMNPGHRQARAVDFVSQIGALKAPELLDQLVAKKVLNADPSSIARAPSALDQLVEKRVKELRPSLVEDRAVDLDEALMSPKRAFSTVRPWLQAATAGLALVAGVLLIARAGQPVSHDEQASSEIATAELAAHGDILRTASGLAFKVTYLDSSTHTEADRSVVRAVVGLPNLGGKK